MCWLQCTHSQAQGPKGQAGLAQGLQEGGRRWNEVGKGWNRAGKERNGKACEGDREGVETGAGF